jgi:hypothetical protein
MSARAFINDTLLPWLEHERPDRPGGNQHYRRGLDDARKEMAAFLEAHRRQWDTDPRSHAPIQASEKQGRAYTVDNRLGYRVEDTPRGRHRQIRFADREGSGQPLDDDVLDVLFDHRPAVGWAATEPHRQARPTSDGLHAIEKIDEALARIGNRER